MVKAENIVRNGDEVTFDCFEEGDRERSHHVVFDVNTWEILNGENKSNLFILHAIAKLEKILEEKGELPKKAISMCY